MISDFDTRQSDAWLFKRLPAGPIRHNLILIGLCSLLLSVTSFAQDPPAPEGKGKNPYVLEGNEDAAAPPVKRARVRRAPQRQRQRISPLAIYWQILMLDKQNQESAVARSREFEDGDLVRLAVQVNQDGYLYLIKHRVEKDGQRSPSILISKEAARVAKNEVVELPAGCEPKSMRNGKCWWKTRKSGGREVITTIFTRSALTNIENAARTNRGEEIYIGDNLIFQITQESPPPKHQVWTVTGQQRPEPGGLRGGYITKVSNPYPQAGEVLVERIEFTYR